MSLAKLYRRLGANIDKWERILIKLADESRPQFGNKQEIFNKLMSFSKNVEKYYNSCQQFIALPIVSSTSGKLEMKPAILAIVLPLIISSFSSSGCRWSQKIPRKKAKNKLKKKERIKKKRTKILKKDFSNLFK